MNKWTIFRQGVLEELPLENGKILLPTKPGLGIKVDEEKLKKYSV